MAACLYLRKQSHSLLLKEWPEQAEYLGDNGKVEGEGENSSCGKEACAGCQIQLQDWQLVVPKKLQS